MESKMHRMIGPACALAIGMLSSSALAQEQRQCAPHEDIVKVLNAKYQESQRAIGLINKKAMMEVYISVKGTWTVIVTNETGMSCVMAAGEAWDEMPATALGPAS